MKEEVKSAKAPFFIIDLKSNLTVDDIVKFLNKMTDNGNKTFKNLYAALPYHHLKEASIKFAQSGITFGSSYLNTIDEGSFLAPIAVKMIKEAGAKFVLIGSKEEKRLFKTAPQSLRKKMEKTQQEGIEPILCVGEEKGLKEESGSALQNQLKTALEGFNGTELKVIYQMPFEELADYLPSLEELKNSYALCKKAAQESIPSLAENISWIVQAPIDLAGFSQIVENNPFEGLFFIKSGIFPHAIHEEAAQLFHVHCLNES